MSIEAMFSLIESIEQMYKIDIINLEDYYKLKSNIVDKYQELNKKQCNEELPF